MVYQSSSYVLRYKFSFKKKSDYIYAYIKINTCWLINNNSYLYKIFLQFITFSLLLQFATFIYCFSL